MDVLGWIDVPLRSTFLHALMRMMIELVIGSQIGMSSRASIDSLNIFKEQIKKIRGNSVKIFAARGSKTRKPFPRPPLLAG